MCIRDRGTRALNFSANIAEGEEDSTKNSEGLNFAIVISMSLIIAIGIFFVTPALVSRGFHYLGFNNLLVSLLEGLIRLIFVIGYIYLIGLSKDIRRVFQYHGAEHMAVWTHEAGANLSKSNLRNFIARGGNVFFSQNRINVDIQTQQANPIQSNIFSILDSYGLSIKENLVLDYCDKPENNKLGIYNAFWCAFGFRRRVFDTCMSFMEKSTLKMKVNGNDIKSTPIYGSKAIKVKDYVDLGTWSEIRRLLINYEKDNN